MKIIGVDPGLTGAFAVLEPDGSLIAVEDLPVAQYGKTRWTDAQQLTGRLFDLLGGKPARAAVEQTHAMPGMGSQSASSKGLTLGSVLAALQVAGIALELVTPSTWKGALGLTNPKATDRERKAHALSRARLLFPNADLECVKDHNRAEALLIAHWAVRRGA